MRGGCPVGRCICAARHGEQVVVSRLPSSSAAWAGRVFGDGRVQRQLHGTARERELASAHHTHHTHQALQRNSLSHLSRWWVVGVVGVVGVMREFEGGGPTVPHHVPPDKRQRGSLAIVN
jgi:hypothetical protein